jgi:hypothetical protein
MPTPTYDLLASNVLSSTTSSVTFSSLNTLAAGYRDLVIVITGTMTSSGGLWLRFNSDSSGNYNRVQMQSNGSVSNSTSSTNQASLYTSNTDPFSTSVPTLAQINIFDFNQTDKNKTLLMRINRTDGIVSAVAGRWASTSAITSILIDGDADYAAGTSFYLYGIAA